MTIRSSLIIAVLATLLAGCASVSTDPLQAYHEARPRSILIVPVVNNSIDVMAGMSVLTTLPKTLGEKGYYVFPVNTVKSLLEFEGFNDAQEIHDQPSAELAALFHADAILYVTINKWASKYVVLATKTEVDFSYRIVSQTGELLWQQRQALSYKPANDSGSSDDLLTSLLASAITAAVERAAPNYLPLTRQANSMVFNSKRPLLPPGPYAHNYIKYYQSVDEAAAHAIDEAVVETESEIKPES